MYRARSFHCRRAFFAWFVAFVTSLLGVGAAPSALAQGGAADDSCGAIGGGFGPFDYRTIDAHSKNLVESSHFTPNVEALVKSVTGYIDADIDYTLRAIPNHHRALVSMMRLGERSKLAKLPKANYSVECYFKRGIRWRADDNVVRMLYVNFLQRAKRRDEALGQLSLVVKSAGENPFTHYNAGLLYFELGDYASALEQAHRAMALGFPRLTLKEQLTSAGKWSDPVSSNVPVPQSTDSAASSPTR